MIWNLSKQVFIKNKYNNASQDRKDDNVSIIFHAIWINKVHLINRPLL